MNRILILALCVAPAALPQEKTMTCNEEHARERGHYCEIREVTVPASGRLDVDGGVNGGISIKGANRNDVLVRAKVQAGEDDEADSRRMVAAIRVETAGGRVAATGPSEGHHGWAVSYEIFVPQLTDLKLHTHNGGIRIAGVKGRMEFEAMNGGVSLADLAGSVEGHTTNGGLNVELASDHWDGDRCDVSTTNGGVTVRVPSHYSAHLETGTVNGGLKIDFPVMVQGEISRHLELDLGSGGKLVRATTTNGGVRIERM
ncbi:MAG: DUF4097 family beta strand repeat-containing protein [Bryobacteraceae bacterium]